MSCHVPGCMGNKKKVRLHGFPTRNDKMYEIWIKRANNPKLDGIKLEIMRTSRFVCDNHFADCCKIEPPKRKMSNLKVNALPTINMPGFDGDPLNEENCLLDKATFQLEMITYPLRENVILQKSCLTITLFLHIVMELM
ncbi:uncharacterized protein LOC113389341 isoform X3 [Ctenocephalides felis]|uniref:uncharacterized protein LOC113389341 isoform X3 n=1 Tax=Ctenocephalides felis TaxID=7515 RepID=UPI000E6E1B74|nr:uncharacterized protein LOC113389341 isoform X3 [Ctenocephalides felis]